MPRPKNTPRSPVVSLSTIIWANIVKWQIIRGISDEELGLLLGVQRLDARKRSHYITGEEIEKVCGLFSVEPEKLLER